MNNPIEWMRNNPPPLWLQWGLSILCLLLSVSMLLRPCAALELREQNLIDSGCRELTKGSYECRQTELWSGKPVLVNYDHNLRRVCVSGDRINWCVEMMG